MIYEPSRLDAHISTLLLLRSDVKSILAPFSSAKRPLSDVNGPGAFLLSFASGRFVDSPEAGPPSGQAWPAGGSPSEREAARMPWPRAH